MTVLPIHTVIPEIKSQLQQKNNAVLIAPPGAGKTTVVPLALLNEPWLENRKIIMLEPRRLAAKNAATWMASQLGEPVGQTVGYRMRLDTCVSKNTKIEVVTEGILTRIIQNDIALENYGLVIFDEFHERSLFADLGLALTLDVQQQLNETLRILVMSATLDGEVVSTILGDAAVIKSEGRTFPIDVRYNGKGANSFSRRDLTSRVVSCVLSAIKHDKGSILVFLPGVAEIKKTYEALNTALAEKDKTIVYPLYSNLTQVDQEKAIAPCAALDSQYERKIVLATSIAETSLTIDGVSIVVDSGLVRQPSFDARNGLSVLETVRVSKASAEQRAGRAGRTEPGICYRLWTSAEQSGLIKQNEVEIKQADLTMLALELAQWGASPQELSWIDLPPISGFSQSTKLLTSLNAIDAKGVVTSHGQSIMQLGLHPRLAHMILASEKQGWGVLACDVAAILNERDFISFAYGEYDADLALRVTLLKMQSRTQLYQTNFLTKQRIVKNAKDLKRQLKLKCDEDNNALKYLGVILAFAYPDRIAKTRKDSNARYQLSNGVGAMVDDVDRLSNADFLVVANLKVSSFKNSNQKSSGNNKEAKIYLAAEITQDQMEKYLSDIIKESDLIIWDSASRSVCSQRVKAIDKLILSAKPLAKPNAEAIAKALLKGVRQIGLHCLPWDKESESFKQRIQFLHYCQVDGGWPDLSDEYLLLHLEEWLLPFINNMSRIDHLRQLKLNDILNSMLDWAMQKKMDALAPQRFKVPSGSQIFIDYKDAKTPSLAVRMQELFGSETTPKINQGRTNLTLHLLSPARRPIQITQDLANFWESTYSDVKKDLKGRYPKHYWPDDPREAIATKRTKKFM